MSCCASHNQSAQRELFLKHQVDGSGEVTLASYAYDNLGRLQSKSLYGSAANKQSYTYNDPQLADGHQWNEVHPESVLQHWHRCCQVQRQHQQHAFKSIIRFNPSGVYMQRMKKR